MDARNFADYVQIFFQYGPFAILPYLMIIALPRLYKKLKTAPSVLKPILKRNIWMYQILTVSLVLFCVGFWVSYFSGPKFYYGEVIDLPTSDYALKSPDLHLRTVTTAGESTIQWIWQKGEGQSDAKICFIRGNASFAEKSFYLYDDDLKGGRCRLVYNQEDGYLYYQGNPLPTKRKTVAKNLNRNVGFGILALYAHTGVDVNKILSLLQAVDFNIRSQTVEVVLELSLKDKDTVNAVLYKGFGAFKEVRDRPQVQYQPYNLEYLLSSLLTIANRLMIEPWSHFDHWMELLGEDGVDLLVEAAGSYDSQIQSMALDFLLRFNEGFFPQVQPKMQSEEYRQNENYTRGALNFTARLPGQKELFEDLQQQQWIQSKRTYLDTVEMNIRQMVIPETDGLSPQLSQVIEMAMELKAQNVRYTWGGKSVDEGFDSAAFIAYILTRAGIHQAQALKDPDLWQIGILRSNVGERRQEDQSPETGDLVFYMDGFVMLCLGENRIIGMTEKGIMVSNYLEFRGKPIQVNRIVYE